MARKEHASRKVLDTRQGERVRVMDGSRRHAREEHHRTSRNRISDVGRCHAR